ncbi:PRC-barrel domain-containing protein [Geodermatophilus sp. SYSU D00758]
MEEPLRRRRTPEEETMDLPDRDEARTWVGLTVVDREGAEIGRCTAVFADEATGRPEWVSAELDGATVVVPVVDATEQAGQVRVTVTRDAVAAAPHRDAGRQLSEAEEADLYRHYGIRASREASETLLPAGAGEDGPGEDSSGEHGEQQAGTPVAPMPAGGTASTPSAPPAAQPSSTSDTAPAARRSRLPAALGVAAALAALVAAVRAARLRARAPWERRLEARPPWERQLHARPPWERRLRPRRPWERRPPTPAERVSRGARTASGAARRGTRKAGAVAVPAAATAGALARRGTRAGTEAGLRAARATNRRVKRLR